MPATLPFFRAGAIHYFIAATVIVTITASCSSTRSSRSGNALPDSLLTDRDGNRYTIKLFPDNNLWMTANLTMNIPGSYCYDNKEENCLRYGRLYTWQAANHGCSLLGEGWRLATKAEWQQLARLYSDAPEDSIKTGKNAYKVFMNPNTAQFNALMGGGRGVHDEYARMEAHGFYWTGTETGNTTAWFCNIGKGFQFLNYHNDGEKAGAYSVRCVKPGNQ